MALERFEPAQYSTPDLYFLLDNLGQSPAVAMRKELAPGTHPANLRYVLNTVYELEQIKQAEKGFAWAGVEALVDSISRYLKWLDLQQEFARRKVRDHAGALILHPSMYTWDSDGKAFKWGVDADAADMVRTEILPDGSRMEFGVTLANPSGEKLPHISDVAPWIKVGPNKPRPEDKILEHQSDKNPRMGSLQCTICDHREEFDRRNAQHKRAAMGRMHLHLKRATVDVNRHRVLLARMGR